MPARLRLVKCDIVPVAQPICEYCVTLVRGTVRDILLGRRQFSAYGRYRGVDLQFLAPLDELTEFDDPVGPDGLFALRYYTFDWLAERRRKYDEKLVRGKTVVIAVEEAVKLGPTARFWRYALTQDMEK